MLEDESRAAEQSGYQPEHDLRFLGATFRPPPPPPPHTHILGK